MRNNAELMFATLFVLENLIPYFLNKVDSKFFCKFNKRFILNTGYTQNNSY